LLDDDDEEEEGVFIDEKVVSKFLLLRVRESFV